VDVVTRFLWWSGLETRHAVWGGVLRLIHSFVLAFVLVGFGFTLDPAPKRIISLAPSLTETLFSLGLGDRVVGVTRYCDYPEEAKNCTQLGGILDPNLELILALKPDLVVLLTAHKDLETRLKKVGLRTLSTPHQSLEDIHRTIELVGKACHAQKEAEALLEDLANRRTAIKKLRSTNPTPNILVVLGRDADTNSFEGMYLAGGKGFYHELIELAGANNAWNEPGVSFPKLSAEGLLSLNPDGIIELVSRFDTKRTEEKVLESWQTFAALDAVRQKHIAIIAGDHALRPGPRYILFLEELAHVLTKWEN